MAITLFTGYPGHGKTTALAVKAKECLNSSLSLYKKHNVIRPLYTNIVFSPKIEEEYARFIKYFDDIREMPTWKDCDIFIDEMSLYFDSQQWEKLPLSIKRYLRLHRHYDVNIYAAVQDFNTVDITVRRLTTRLYHSVKILSTREPSPFLPPIRFPFSLNRLGLVTKSHWELEKEHYEYDSWEFRLYTKSAFSIFDTRQEIPDQPLPVIFKHWREIEYVGGDKSGLRTGRYI